MSAPLAEPGRKLYEQSIANDPTIHCNRFPSWPELTKQERNHWNAKAAALSAPQEPAQSLPTAPELAVLMKAFRHAWEGNKAGAASYIELAAEKIGGDQARYIRETLAVLKGEKEPVYVTTQEASPQPPHAEPHPSEAREALAELVAELTRVDPIGSVKLATLLKKAAAVLSKGALTDEPAEAFKRGYEEGLNDTLRNGLDWAWLYFKGNPDRLPSKTSVHPAAPSLGDRR